MICKNCGTDYQDGMSFCPNCGTPAQDANQYQQYSQQEEPYTMPNYGMPNNLQPNVNKPTTVWQYLGWTVLAYIFGPVSLIISIVFACMPENKNRANFFRAQLIMWAIMIVLCIIFVAIFAAVGFSLLGSADVGDYYGYYEYYDDFLRIASQFRF